MAKIAGIPKTQFDTILKVLKVHVLGLTNFHIDHAAKHLF
jgi:hypothetical protein